MGDKILGNNLYLLEKNINVSKLSFNKEVNLLEFVEIIDNMDIAHLIDCKKRDILLKKRGKQLFKKHPQRKHKIYLEIRHETRVCSQAKIDSLLYNNKTEILSQEEIDRILTPIDKQ
jgi:hypothetical protein